MHTIICSYNVASLARTAQKPPVESALAWHELVYVEILLPFICRQTTVVKINDGST